MESNPYAPPESMKHTPWHKHKRPIAIWLFLAVIVAKSAVISIHVAKFAGTLITGAHRPASQLAVFGFLAVSKSLAILGVLAAAFWGICTQKQWGRWLGLILLLLSAILSIFGNDTTVYDSPAEQAGGTLARLYLIPLLLVCWAYALAFSAKSRRYFGTAPDEGHKTPPTPACDCTRTGDSSI